ncbi:MAG: TIGR00725 family protein [Chloroflexota bacterium]
MIIGVIGDGRCSKDEAEAAEAVGRLLAERRATVICGGLTGVMEAVCRGAKSADGRTIGVLPGEDRAAANLYVDVPIVTGVGYARNMAVVKSADAVIAVGGRYGTLSEIAYALQGDVPVVGLNTWRLSRAGEDKDPLHRAHSAGEAVDLAIHLGERRATWSMRAGEE